MAEREKKPRKPARKILPAVIDLLESAFPRLRALLDGDVLERLAKLEARVAEIEAAERSRGR